MWVIIPTLRATAQKSGRSRTARPRPHVASRPAAYTRRAQRFLPDWTVVPAEKSDASTL